MEKYKCPKCDTEFSLGTKFCEKCGCNLEMEFIETPTCPKCKKTFPAGTVFCSDDGTKLVSPEKMIPKCVKCGKAYTDGTKFCINDGGKVIPEALRKGMDFDNAKGLIADNIGKGKKLIDKMNLPQKLGIVVGLVTIIIFVIVLPGGSPGRNTAKAFCKCAEVEFKKSGYGKVTDRGEREINRCFQKKVEKYWKYIDGDISSPLYIKFKNPKHQREFEETSEECMKKLEKKYNLR